MASNTLSGRTEVTLVLNRHDYAGSYYPEEMNSFRKKLIKLLQRVGFTGEFQIKVFSYRLHQVCSRADSLAVGAKNGEALEICYCHSEESLAEHVWLLCYKEKEIPFLCDLLQEELARQAEGLPPLFKAQTTSPPVEDKPVPKKESLTSGWPHSLALKVPPKPVRPPIEEKPEPLPLVESEVVIETLPETTTAGADPEPEVSEVELPEEVVTENDLSTQTEPEQNIDTLADVPPKTEEEVPESDSVIEEETEESQAETLPPMEEESPQEEREAPETPPTPLPVTVPPAHIMDDTRGVAHVLLFLWAEADARGKVWKGTLTGLLKEYYGKAEFRKVNPAHQTFVAQGFLKRVTGEEYGFTAEGQAFLKQHEEILKSSERVQVTLEMFRERAAHADQEKSIFSRDLARQARLGIERLRQFVS
jgi:hypothetical protein